MRTNEHLMAEFDAATKNFKVVHQSVGGGVSFVEAENKSGSKYQVAASYLPGMGGEYTGGPFLVTVIQPWQTAYCVSGDTPIYPSYIAEKFLRPGRETSAVHGADLQGVTGAINYALSLLAGGAASL